MIERERRILGLVMMDEADLLRQLRFGVRLKAEDLGEYGQLWTSICNLADQKYAIKPEVLAQEGYDYDVMMDIAGEGFVATTGEVLAYARKLVEESQLRRVKNGLVKAQNDLEAGVSMTEIQSNLNRTFMTRRGGTVQDPRANAIRKRIDQTKGDGNSVIITPTQIAWLDKLISGGLTNKRFMAIGGGQKRRKSTLARNIMLGAARIGKEPNPNASIAYMCFENDQEITYFDFVAMLAAEYLWESGDYSTLLVNKTTNETYPIHVWLDGEKIQKAYRGDKLGYWDAKLQEAIHYGMDLMDKLNIYIYDRQAENGNLTSLENLQTVFGSHKYEYVSQGQHYIACIDYAQLVYNEGDDYKDMKAISNFGLSAMQELDCTVIMLSQFNENANWQAAQGNKMDIIGTKGGGDLNAAVQNYLTVNYDRKSPDELMVEMKLGRRAPQSEAVFHIHPASGYIIQQIS